MRAALFWTIVIVFAPAALNAADDTFSCLSSFTGPMQVISNNFGYTQFVNNTFSAGTRFDARGAVWKHETVPTDRMPDANVRNTSITIGQAGSPVGPKPAVCFAGGLVDGTNDPNQPWGAGKEHEGQSIFFNSNGGILDGLRANRISHDGMDVHGTNVRVKDVWVSNVLDDCIENDGSMPGTFEDSLFENCYVGIANDPGNPPAGVTWPNKKGNIITMNGLLLHLSKKNMSDRDYSEYGPFIKIRYVEDIGPSYKIYNSVFAFNGDPGSSGRARQALAWRNTVDCKNNVLAWLPDTPYPSSYPKPPSCFRVVQGAEARALWSAARLNWINCHPKVARATGDPQSDFSKCDTNAYGGGGTATPGATQQPGPCNLYPSGSTPPQGYGASWNPQTSARELLIGANCSGGVGAPVTYTVGSGANNQYVYKQGYYFEAQWKPYTLTGTFVQNSTDWLAGKGTLTATRPADQHFYVGYVCHWTGTVWKCGCRDAACATNYWQLQAVPR